MLTIKDIITLIYFIAPAYAANSTPVIFSGNRPLDLGKTFLMVKKFLATTKPLREQSGDCYADLLCQL